MLKIFYGDMESEKYIFNPDGFFNNVNEDEWITDPISQQMIKDIDKSEVLSSHAIDSPVLGIIPPTSLSGGVKALILINEIQDELFNASNCGDNCAQWLLKIGERKDVTVNLRHIMSFGDGTFDIHVVNTDETGHDMKQLVRTAGGFV